MSDLRYSVIATAPYETVDADLNPVTLPIGTVVNIVLWDGVSAWSPGDGLIARLQTNEQIGDVVSL